MSTARRQRRSPPGSAVWGLVDARGEPAQGVRGKPSWAGAPCVTPRTEVCRMETTPEHEDERFDPGLWAHYAAAIVGAWFFMSSLVWHDGMAVQRLDSIPAPLVV